MVLFHIRPFHWQKDRAITSLGCESASSGGQKGSWVTGRPNPLSHERRICLPSLALLIKLTLRYHSEAWTSLIALGLAWGHEKNTSKHTHITHASTVQTSDTDQCIHVIYLRKLPFSHTLKTACKNKHASICNIYGVQYIHIYICVCVFYFHFLIFIIYKSLYSNNKSVENVLNSY